MSRIIKRLASFGPFTLDLSAHVLLRREKRIELSPRAISILEYLVDQRARCVSKADLRREFWADVRVEDNNIDRQVSAIRRALGDSVKNPRFIETRYTLGWQFIAPVVERQEAEVDAEIETVPAGNLTETVGPALDASSVRISQTESLVVPNRAYRRTALLLSALVVTGAAVLVWGTSEREPRVLDFVQLTNDGKWKAGPLLTAGKRLYFREMVDYTYRAVSIPISGGEPVRLRIPLAIFELKDISPDGSKLLVRSSETDGPKLWSYFISTQSLQPLASGFVEAAWASDGHTLALSDPTGSSIQVTDGPIGGKVQLPGRADSLKWTPSGEKLRFSLFDAKHESFSEWEIAQRGHARRLSSVSDGQTYVRDGNWSHDGRYFFFEAGTEWHQDIWVLRESFGLDALRLAKPRQLTRGGPGSWRWPTPSSERSTVFAMNDFVSSEFVRFDPQTRMWRQQWEGTPAYELNYSRDSNWVTYTYLWDHTIWKAKPDGTGRIQLTPAGIEGHQPHWSPDGKHIAFMGKNANGQWRVFQVLANGRELEELVSNGEDQGVPSWSPDGRFLIFGERLGRKPRSQMTIHRLDTVRRTISEIAGTKGLWSPRWSPDGRYIAAVTSDTHALRVTSQPEGHWTELIRTKLVDNVAWSADSRWLYFNEKDDNEHWWVCRIAVPEATLEHLVDLTDFTPAPENWYGVAPDGTLLAFRGARAHEIYALKCLLP